MFLFIETQIRQVLDKTKTLINTGATRELVRNAGLVNGLATKYVTEHSGEFNVKKCEARMQQIGANELNKQVFKQPPSSFNLVELSIKNPNFYSREITLISRSGEQTTIIIGATSLGKVEVNAGYYKLQSKTTFTKMIIEQTSININNDKTIILSKDDKN